MRYAVTVVVLMLGLALIAPCALAADEKEGSKVAEGWIHAVDLKAMTFVLGGKNESQTTFRLGAGEREADVYLDGNKTSPAAALKPGRKASVTYVKIGEVLWASKIEVTSAAK